MTTVKQGLQCAIQHHPTLEQGEILQRSEIRMQDLKHWWNDNDPTRHMPLNTFGRVVRVTGRIELINLWLADHQLDERVLVVESTDGKTEGELLDEVLEAQAAAGEVARELHEARRDHRLDDDELARIARAASRAEAEHAQVRDAVRRIRDQRASRLRVMPRAVGDR